MSQIIFMIHGMTAGGWIWENYQKFFENKNYTCITPTLRHHEGDPKATPDPALGTTSILDYVEDLEKDIHKLETRPIIMDHSMGGLIAQILGGKGLASALVLLSPAPPAGISIFHWSLLKGPWPSMIRFGFWKKPVRQSYKELKYSVLNRTPEKEGKALYDRLGYESGRAVWEIGFWRFDSKIATRVNESNITCPVLVIAGSQDRVIHSSIANKVAKKYESVATYEEFPDHAHNILWEPGWAKVAEHAHGWIKRKLQ